MARMDRLTVRGFKSIRALENFELRGLNVLIGANGVGKSNLLSVFWMLEQLSRKRLQLFVRSSGGPEGLLFGGRKRTSSVSADVVFDGGHRRYGFSLETAGSDGMAFAGESVRPGIAESDRYVDRGVASGTARQPRAFPAPSSRTPPGALSTGGRRRPDCSTVLRGLLVSGRPEPGRPNGAGMVPGLTVLAEMLQTASDERQVIVATQSADLVSELAPEDVVVVDRRDGESVFTRLDGDDLRGWLEDYSLGDLWRTNVVGGRP